MFKGRTYSGIHTRSNAPFRLLPRSCPTLFRHPVIHRFPFRSFESNFPSFSCFVPCHITGFFEICDHEDPLMKGSKGCGLVLDKGVSVTVTFVPNDSVSLLLSRFLSLYSTGLKSLEKMSIHGYSVPVVVLLNKKCVEGKVIQSLVYNIVTSFSLSQKQRIFNVFKTHTLVISEESRFPQSCGFGVSAAGCLGTSNALFSLLNYFDSLCFSPINSCRWADLAHTTEVLEGSGLGDVSAILAGGLAFRKKPGAPSKGCVRRVPCSSKKLFYTTMSSIETSSVLTDPEKSTVIRAAGRKAMDAFSKNESLENFMRTSLQFAQEIDLMSPPVKKALSLIDPSLASASQAMLGNTVFAITNDFSSGKNTNSEKAKKSMNQIAEKHVYKTFSAFGPVHTCFIANYDTEIKSFKI